MPTSALSPRLSTAGSAAPQLDSAVLSVTGNPEGQNRISQTLSISGSKDDTFVLSGWAKGNSAPISSTGDGSKPLKKS